MADPVTCWSISPFTNYTSRQSYWFLIVAACQITIRIKFHRWRQRLANVINYKLYKNTTFTFFSTDISSMPVAFFGMVMITSVHRQMSRRTACHRCEKVDRTPRRARQFITSELQADIQLVDHIKDTGTTGVDAPEASSIRLLQL